jgi:hypothetical protein
VTNDAHGRIVADNYLMLNADIRMHRLIPNPLLRTTLW